MNASQPAMQTMPTSTAEKSSSKSNPIITTPLWVSVVRGFQFFFAIIILGLSGYIIHWVYMDELGFTLAMSLFTWIIVLYVLLTEKMTSLRGGYNIWAVLALDVFCIICWLSAMGAAAARRGTFTVDVNASCTSDGSAVNSGSCTIHGRSLGKRAIVMSYGALAMLSGIAGLSALEMLLFVATFAYILRGYIRHRKANAPAAAAATSQGEIQMETKQPFLTTESQAYPQQTQPYQQQTTQQQHMTPTPPPMMQQQQQQQQQQPPYSPPQNYQEMPLNHPAQYQEMPAGQMYQGPPPTQQQAHEVPGNYQYQSYPPQQYPPQGYPPQGYPPQQQQQQQQPPYAPSQTPVSQISPTTSPAPHQQHMYQYPPHQ